MKAALSTKTGTVTTQQMRQLSLHQQFMAHQRKLPQQKVAQLSQVDNITVVIYNLVGITL